jgi:tetratricopeptide (TPR) repeat protein
MATRANCGRWPGLQGLAALVLLALSLGPGSGPAGAAGDDLAATLGEAQALLAEGRAAEAWARLSPLELEVAGSPYYDYLYGIAALDTGRNAAAITALQRVLVREPDFAGARMELARALYEAGDYPAAEQQFRYLLAQSPPPATQAVIERYLDAIDQGPGLASAGRSRFVPYAEVGAGWDSNANASTGSDTFGIFVLDPDNVETSSPFVELAGGFQHGVATGPGGAVLSSGRASYRSNPDASFVDQLLLALGTTGQKSWGATRASIGASGYYSWLDGSQHELGAGVDLGLARQLGAGWELASAARAGIVRYQQDELEVLDVDRYLGSLALTRTGIGTRNGRVGFVALFGTDVATDASSPYGNQRLGARLFGGWQPGPGSSLYLEAAWAETDYDDSPGFFGEDRRDDQWALAVSTEYRDWPARGYSLVPTLRYTNTNSTVSLYDYDRFELGVYLRRSKR